MIIGSVNAGSLQSVAKKNENKDIIYWLNFRDELFSVERIYK
jgi:hypothetical protein